MAIHSAKSLFDKNIQSAKECLQLYDSLIALKPKKVNPEWILRASVVFTVSAIDTYFHDKIRYKVGKFSLENLPPALGSLQIKVKNLIEWDNNERKGNVLRNWVTEYLSTKPLQSQHIIAESLKYAGIEALWDRIEPDPQNKDALLKELNELIKRRNQISHEGDRMTSRSSGKQLREIERDKVDNWIKFSEKLIQKIEDAFPS